MSGFLVWNPARSLPTVRHDTYAKAKAERDRLAEANPGETFHVMAPVRSSKAMEAAAAYSTGWKQGITDRTAEVRVAETRLDAMHTEHRRLQASTLDLAPFRHKAEEFQSIVADCLCWFDGFTAAYAHREGYERPHTPDRDKIRDLNGALQKVLRNRGRDSDLEFDDGIPF